MKNWLKKTPKPPAPIVGFDPVADIGPTDRLIYEQIKPFTMTSIERVANVVASVEYLCRNQIEGDIVECGVWRGGCMMAAALALMRQGDRSRRIFLCDTFEGMSAPTEEDRSYDGIAAQTLLNETPKGEGVWCEASIEDVKANLASTGYPAENLAFIKGKIEHTIPDDRIGRIALLRLDTDWYESTRHEFEHLYPKLAPHGVCIVDDYGHWAGARQATDEYFAKQPFKPMLSRIDYTGRMIIKPAV